MNILAVIPARGGSTRLKRKNIRKVLGKPMIQYAIDACKNSVHDITCYVSSEDNEIKQVSLSAGARIHNREKNLSDDKTYKQVVIASAVKSICENLENKPDLVISLQANSPEIESKHIDNAIKVKKKFGIKEIFSVDDNLMQNGAFRIMDYDTVFLNTLSMYCGVFICDIVDVHTIEDLKAAEDNIMSRNNNAG
jgi:CMP-N-acetylneuraminic acid synthetase